MAQILYESAQKRKQTKKTAALGSAAGVNITENPGRYD